MTSRWARAAVGHVAGRSRGGPLDPRWRVTLNFHPDRETDGVPMLERLVREGVYRNQFETGTSNGGLTARPGGARWRWERRIFDGAYDDAPPAERPKYGALNHRQRRVGAAPRFGSAHLRLAEHTRDRTTFCFPDSVFEPESFGTATAFGLLPLADAFDAVRRDDRMEQEQGGMLDDYVEAHVHGVVDLATDVEALVLDPCYRDTVLARVADRLPVPVEWHDGLQLTVDELREHPHFRGPRVIEVGGAVARDGLLDARIVGAAHRDARHDPQDLKKVWHHVARFGRPRTGAR